MIIMSVELFRKVRREYNYAERIVIRKRREDNCVGRSGTDDPVAAGSKTWVCGC